jgi:hypothetical protein
VYVFQASVTALSATPTTNAATVSVTVTSGGVDAVLEGGDKQVGSEAVWTLDASGSKDLDRVAEEALRCVRERALVAPAYGARPAAGFVLSSSCALSPCV